MKRTYLAVLLAAVTFFVQPSFGQTKVPPARMEQVYQEIKTPFKYGVVMAPSGKKKMTDSPTVFRYGNKWRMTYIVYDGQGYETWLAESDNLLDWKTVGRIMSFTNGTWDANQKAGYPALQRYEWGGSYELEKYDGKYWMSYLGGADKGYEAGALGIGIAYTSQLAPAVEWTRVPQPVLVPTDSNARWYDNGSLFKSTVIHDRTGSIGYPFVMFYNAINQTAGGRYLQAERISMAVSSDMVHWKRYGEEPVIDHYYGISGDAFITKMNDLWVMFYFGAAWKPGAFERFACSYDLKNWTDWNGPDLVAPSESYDKTYAHKPCVVKYNGVVYHYYCAVNRAPDGVEERCIAVATSADMGKSKLTFPKQ